VNTTLSAAAGGLTLFLLRFAQSRKYELPAMCNGILAGLVGICAGVGTMSPGCAIITGLISAVCCEIGHVAMFKAQIDDPIDAFAVHGCAGMAGLILHPLLSYGGVDFKMLGGNMVGMLAIIAWSGGWTALCFAVLKVVGLLHPTEAEEQRYALNMYRMSSGSWSPRKGAKGSDQNGHQNGHAQDQNGHAQEL